MAIKSISVISVKQTKNQTLKDSLTPTEKKVLILMLNSGLVSGKVRNKIFEINKTGNNTADVNVKTIVKSIVLGRSEIVSHRVKIKYS
jgi:hypothetical protein